MNAALNTQNQEQVMPQDVTQEKSDLMQFFEYQVNDIYWAYKDLFRAILEKDE